MKVADNGIGIEACDRMKENAFGLIGIRERIYAFGGEFVIEGGRKALGEAGLACTDCHEYRGEGSGTGPDLTGWASRSWTIDFIKNPAHKRFYGRRNDRMPAYGERGELTDKEIELVTDWLRGDTDRH